MNTPIVTFLFATNRSPLFEIYGTDEHITELHNHVKAMFKKKTKEVFQEKTTLATMKIQRRTTKREFEKAQLTYIQHTLLFKH